ncbi:hypothetical protein, partial [Phocaeicola coprocola]|uniref:hypothetical protein n=1 Tax=Phocaeicola coprocola TaxID=310298 RepID=UPI001C38AD35
YNGRAIFFYIQSILSDSNKNISIFTLTSSTEVACSNLSQNQSIGDLYKTPIMRKTLEQKIFL